MVQPEPNAPEPLPGEESTAVHAQPPLVEARLEMLHASVREQGQLLALMHSMLVRLEARLDEITAMLK